MPWLSSARASPLQEYQKEVVSGTWQEPQLGHAAGSIKLSEGPHVHIQTVQVQTVTGEAFINNRKNKLIPSYELEVQGSWSGWSHGSTAYDNT